MFRSINPPIPMLLYVWEQESCTKVIPINVLSPQHGYLQPSRSKIAQSKVHVARGDQKHPSRYTGAHREKSTRGVVQEIPYRATNWRRASFSILSYIFHLRDQPFVPSQAITPGSVPRYGRAENASGAQPTGLWFCFAWCVPKISRAWIQPLRVPQASLYASLFEKGDRRYILSASPSRTRTFSFFFFSAISRHHERLLPLTRSCLSANLFRFLCTSHRFGKFHRAFDRSNQRLVSIRGQPNGKEFV